MKKKYIIYLIVLLFVSAILYIFLFKYEKKHDELFIEKNKNVLEEKDSDNDTINDYDEIKLYKTDPNNSDSDGDGLSDKFEFDNLYDPLSRDSDNDGLLDNEAIYVNKVMIAPIDPNPIKYNGPEKMWKKHIETEKKNKAASYLTSFYSYNPDKNIVKKIEEVNWKKIANSKNVIYELANLQLIKELGSKFLMFRLDNYGKVLHSQSSMDIYNYMMGEIKKQLTSSEYKVIETAMNTLGIKNNLQTWQKQFGYNLLFDEVFRIATNSNMRSKQIFFNDGSNNQHVIWMWSGDYLAMGIGAEVGIYRKNTSITSSLSDIKHWDSINFELPMTLHLYNYHSKDNIEHVFSWKPVNKQWWITGFNPNYKNIDVRKNFVIATIDFSTKKDMYNSLKSQNDDLFNNYLLFDDKTYKLWIYW